MAESMHERYDRDERALTGSASDELWTNELSDAVVDVTAPILQASAWDGLPNDAPARTTERYTAAAALVRLSLEFRGSRSLGSGLDSAVKELPAGVIG
jgi:hypothetical protein